MKLNSQNMNINLRHLRALHAVQAAGSFSAAASLLGVVPSALTELIRQMEAEVGAPLFDRRMRPPRPTALGLSFLQDTASVLADLERALTHLRAQAGLQEGRLAIGAAPSAISKLVGPAMARFHQDHPAICCLLHDDIAEVLAQKVTAGALDLAVAGRATSSEDLTQIEIDRDPFGLACHRDDPLTRAQEVRLADLAPARRVSVSAETGTSQLLAQAGLPLCFQQGPIMAHSTIAQLSLIRAGLGYALMPRNAVELFEDPAIRFVEISDLVLWRSLFVLLPARRPISHIATRFLQDYLNVKAAPV